MIHGYKEFSIWLAGPKAKTVVEGKERTKILRSGVQGDSTREKAEGNICITQDRASMTHLDIAKYSVY